VNTTQQFTGALHEHEAALERRLREEVIAGHEEYMADPSKGTPAEAILERIKARVPRPADNET
jgi:antitoxin ParD1/3/4